MSNSRSMAQVPCSASNARNLSRAKHVCNVARSMGKATDFLPEGRLLLCGIVFALRHRVSLRAFPPLGRPHRRGT